MTDSAALLVHKIREALKRAEDAKWDYARWQGHSDAKARTASEGSYSDPIAVIKWNLSRAFQDLCLLAEHLKLAQFARRIAQYEKSHGGKLGSVRFDSEYENTVAPHLEEAESYLDSLLALGAGSTVESGMAFQSILESAAVVTRSRTRNPKKEKDVRDALEELLAYAYPDLTKSLTIPYPVKPYIPDFASEEARALAEFKFVRKKGDMGKVCEELHGDMFGYSGDATWKSKFGVIYQAGAFWTDARVFAHMKKVGRKYFPATGFPSDWKLIIVTGRDDESIVKRRRLEKTNGAGVVTRRAPRGRRKHAGKRKKTKSVKVR